MDHATRTAAYSWYISIFRNASFVFDSVKILLSQSHPPGLEWVNREARVKRRFVDPDAVDLGPAVNAAQPLQRLIDVTMPNTRQPQSLRNQLALDASPLNAKTYYDYCVFMSQRLVNDLGPDTALSDVIIGQMARAYLKPTSHEGFDIARYRAFSQPLDPSISLLVLEAMHPEHVPMPQLVAYAVPNRVRHFNVYLQLFRHSSLRIPLATIQNGRQGGLLLPDGQAPWLAGFCRALLLYAPQAAVTWDHPFPGVQTPMFAQAKWMTRDAELEQLARRLHDGWLWCLAGLHWILVYLCQSCQTQEQYRGGIKYLQHYLAALFLVRCYSPGSAPIQCLDVSNTCILPSNRWIANVTRLQEEAYDVGSLLEQWTREQIVQHAILEDYTHPSNSLEIEERTRSHLSFQADEQDPLSDWRVAVLGWRKVLGRLDKGLAKYVEDESYC